MTKLRLTPTRSILFLSGLLLAAFLVFFLTISKKTCTYYNLEFAAKNDDVVFLRNCIQNGFSPEKAIKGWANKDKVTIIHLAVEHYSLDMINYLEEIGVDFNVTDMYGRTPIMTDLRWGNRPGFSEELFRVLLRNSELCRRDKLDRTAFDYLLHSGHQHQFEMLIESGPIPKDIASKIRKSINALEEYLTDPIHGNPKVFQLFKEHLSKDR